jgi:hypothetical protein
MIRVKRVIGESIDLETGATTGKGIVLTNGVSEMAIEVDDAAIEGVLRLIAEVGGPVRALLEEDTDPAPDPPRTHVVESGLQLPDDDWDPGESYGGGGATSI